MTKEMKRILLASILIFLVVFLAGGSFFDIFPLRGLVSTDWQSLNWFEKILDYLWHITLPVFSLVISGFATLTMLTKNSFMDEINKLYVSTAKAKGLSEKRVLYGHVFRNAMLIVVAGFPAAFITVLFTGALLIEVIFSLDGLGLLGYESVLNRDYPVVFGTLFIFSFFGALIFYLVSNFGVWALGSFGVYNVPYEKNLSGLIECYILAIPFFGNTFFSTLIFSYTAFLANSLYKKKFI